MEANKVIQAKNGTPPVQAAMDRHALTRADKAGDTAQLFEGTEKLEIPVIPAEPRARMDAHDRIQHAKIEARIAERRLQKHSACARI